jgi:hypothetical protein
MSIKVRVRIFRQVHHYVYPPSSDGMVMNMVGVKTEGPAAKCDLNHSRGFDLVSGEGRGGHTDKCTPYSAYIELGVL